MPLYTTRCQSCSHVDEDVFARMASSHVCSKCGAAAERIPVLAHTDLKDFAIPIELQSIACTSVSEIREMQRAGVTISDDPNDELYGVPIAHNRREKLRALKTAGFVETN